MKWDLALKSAGTGSSTDPILPPSSSNFTFENVLDGSANAQYTLQGDPNEFIN